MRDHPHLSIGEVLSLLRDEFPDITISKIRFLESQGLLDPERTPSGYRKFYEPDLSRLRWILTQQRDHFLPLRVIKDRLDAGFVPGTAEGAEPFPAPAPATASVTGAADADALTEAAGGGGPGGRGDSGPGGPASPAGGVAPGGFPQGAADDRAEPDDSLDGVAGNGRPPSTGAPSVTDDVDDGPAASAVEDREEAAFRDHEAAAGDAIAAGEDAGVEDDEGAGAHVQARSGTGGRWAERRAEWGGGRVANGPRTGRPEPPEGRRRPDPAALGLSLTELAAACGQTVAELNELERFGIIAGERVGAEVVYGEDALLIARLAGRFGRHGIEPRHLRQYRVAAEREVALMEQVVAPFLRARGRPGQADPAAVSARQAALETVDELAALGEDLRRVLVERALRDYLAGA